MMTREEHLAWCKQRALAYVDAGDLTNAFSSMASNLEAHPETVGHSANLIGFGLLMTGSLNTPEAMRKFIKGYN